MDLIPLRSLPFTSQDSLSCRAAFSAKHFSSSSLIFYLANAELSGSRTFRPTLVRPYQFGLHLFFRRVGRMGWAEQPSIRPSTFSFGSWAEWAGPNSPVFDPVLGENIISTRHLGSPTPLKSKAEPGVGMGLDNYKEVHYPNLHRKRRQVMA